MLFFSKPDKIVIRPRDEHPISRKNIAPEALKVLYRLNDAGFKAYLVGGSVRDLLLGRCPKDFDISTDAQPREIKRLFRNCFLVGRRFRLAHIVFGKKVIETSTFRRQPDDSVPVADENALGAFYQSRDNTFGTPEEDAQRRDFTVNGLFYDIKTFEIIDYVGGLCDLDQRILRVIGDPNVRLREDPVRMMRAVRLAARLDMTIERKTYRAICAHHKEISQAAPARVLEEIFRLFAFNKSESTFRLLWKTRMMAALMPNLDKHVKQNGKEQAALWTLLAKMDELGTQAETTFSNGLHLAVLIYPLFQNAVEKAGKGDNSSVNHLKIAEDCLTDFNHRFKIPKATFFQIIHLLDDQQRLDTAPPPGRRIRAGRAGAFADALLLARIRLSAAAESTVTLDSWEKLMPPQTNRKGDATSKTWRRKKAKNQATANSRTKSTETKSTNKTSKETSPEKDKAASDKPGKRKRSSGSRKRSGRRHDKRRPATDSGKSARANNQHTTVKES